MTAAAFIVFFVLLWLLVTVILGFFSGWYSLTRAFPDRPYEEALAIFKGEKGGWSGRCRCTVSSN